MTKALGPQEIWKKIKAAAQLAGRDPGTLKLLAVSKGQSLERIEAFLKEGVPFWGLGESYLDEMLQKKEAFDSKYPSLSWHFIGRLQSRKIPELLEGADVLHAVSRAKELELIKEDPKSFFVQVNVSGEGSKGGCAPAELGTLLDNVERLGLKPFFLGLMALPSPLDESSEAELRSEMRALRALRDQYCPKGLLNMGTSADYEIAISEGSDVLRIGSLLFGERESR